MTPTINRDRVGNEASPLHREAVYQGAKEIEEAASPAEEPQSKERYVEELAAPDDYWMTITDTARVTRRQDITIRRWIASGDLPVRKNRVGLNRRARQVRASDVAKLTPIIDASAMISGEEARINLTSIPAEQAAIRADHQQLLVALAALRAEMSEQKLATERAMAQQQKSWQQELLMAQERYTQGFTQQQQAMESQQQAMKQKHADLLAQLARHGETVQQQQQQLNQFQDALLAQETRFQNAFREQSRVLEALIEQQRERVQHDITSLRGSIAETNQAITRTAELFTTRLEQVERTGFDLAARQEQALQDLKTSFQQAREATGQQVAALATRLTAYQSNQEQILKRTEERLQHLQAEENHFQQEQAALQQRVTALAAQLGEQQALRERMQGQAAAHFARLEEAFDALKQQLISQEEAQKSSQEAPAIRHPSS